MLQGHQCLLVFDPQTLPLWRGLISQESGKFGIYNILEPILLPKSYTFKVMAFCYTLQGELEMKITVTVVYCT